MSSTSVSRSPLLFILCGYLFAQFSLFSKSDYFVPRTCLSFICCYSLIFSIISMEWDLSFMGLGCMIWQGGVFLAWNSLRNVNPNPYSCCMGFPMKPLVHWFINEVTNHPLSGFQKPTMVCFFAIISPHCLNISPIFPHYLQFVSKLFHVRFAISVSLFRYCHKRLFAACRWTNRRNSMHTCANAIVSKVKYL